VTGMVMNLVELKQIMHKAILDPLDHKVRAVPCRALRCVAGSRLRVCLITWGDAESGQGRGVVPGSGEHDGEPRHLLLAATHRPSLASRCGVTHSTRRALRVSCVVCVVCVCVCECRVSLMDLSASSCPSCHMQACCTKCESTRPKTTW
jgi:hypothetical protein